MGNKLNSNVTSGVKDQAAGESKFPMYKYVDLKGCGELVELMKKANRTKNYKELDDKIDELKKFLYNNGEGKTLHIRDIVKRRCRDRGINMEDKKNNNMELTDMEAMATEVDAHLKKDGCQIKEVCTDLEQRGAVGETALHVCLLCATSIHADLAKRLLKRFPKLIKDIYMSDMYFGENVLHMAIVNEDPALAKFFLDNGADYHQRCNGQFFTANDQIDDRKDNADHEWYDLPVKTNYEGHVYWGEYPLGFAACLGQEECVRLVVAKGADPNLQDTNGNTVLHMLVIHDKKEMFDLLVSLGAKLHIKNRQGLTPLTLAAKLARKDMYEHILELEREVYWIYGNVTCAGYPLEHIDTISETGEINVNSAMYHVVFGDKSGHLDMIDGMIAHLLHEKWKTFAKYRFHRRMLFFVLYFMIFVSAFGLRPGTDKYATIEPRNKTEANGTTYIVNVTIKDPCYLMRIHNDHYIYDVGRLTLEGMTLFGSVLYIFLSLKEVYHQGYAIFFQTLMASPAKCLFLMSNCFVIMMVPGRAACAYIYEDVVGVMAILCTAPYFLFFCRGFKIVGPFVIMIYTMIRTDLLRFFTIYFIFLIGFSQSMFVIFRGVDTQYFHTPLESAMGMFIMSLGEFADIYASFSDTPLVPVARLIFVLYMVLVTLLLVNMLIAMMGNTYQIVSENEKEWLRQWAMIMIVVEQTVTTDERRKQQLKYSQPLKDGRRALVIRWHQSEKEKEELKKQRDASKIKQKNMLQRKQDLRILHNRLDVEEVKKGHINV